jgi:hypothetical protein
MKKLLFWIVIIAIIIMAISFPVVRWIFGICLVLVIGFVVLMSNNSGNEDDRMTKKFGEDYKTAIANGQLGLRTAYPCKPDSHYTSKSTIEEIANIKFPNFTVIECKETLEDFTGDYSGEATIEFSDPIDGDIITQIEDGMQKDGSLWRKGENGEYVCDLLKPYVGEPVTDEYWTLLIQENKREGIIRYGRV